MNIYEMHKANQKHWNAGADPAYKRDEFETWRRCPQEPAIAFEGAALDFINEFVGNMQGKQVCIIGSGDNYATFALAGMGAVVTSTDISERQLENAAKRARILRLDIRFVRCDAADLSPVADESFDLVFSSNGFFVWIADLDAVFSSVNRVLKPGGFYVFYDVHPFQRPWKDQNVIEMEKPYYEIGPYSSGASGQPDYCVNFHWTVGDIVNSLIGSGMNVRRIAETPAVNARFWEGPSYGEGRDQSLQDWHVNPRAGLPVWLTVAAQKPSN